MQGLLRNKLSKVFYLLKESVGEIRRYFLPQSRMRADERGVNDLTISFSIRIQDATLKNNGYVTGRKIE